MERTEVLTVVETYIREVLDDEAPETIDPAQSMKDYGINSLDIVEIVSHTMRALRIKIPRSELANITNIDGLVDVLLEAQTKQ